jgi:hypothetical protein
MLGKKEAMDVAWQLFLTCLSESEVCEVTAYPEDDGQSWAVHFYKRDYPHFVESPGAWIILVDGMTQEASWFDVL